MEGLPVIREELVGKDAESEEAQEHANSSSLALYAYAIVYSREPDKLSSTIWSKISGKGG
jgi:hypothetical protein